jgi:hypothetical protein
MVQAPEQQFGAPHDAGERRAQVVGRRAQVVIAHLDRTLCLFRTDQELRAFLLAPVCRLQRRL